MPRRIFFLALLLLVVAAWPGAGEARSWVIERFEADIQVYLDGSIEVGETIRARFTGSWNGIFRTIPVEYRTPQGFNYTLRLDLERITDDAGRALKYEQSRERHYRKFKIWVPGASDAARTVVLRYRVQNGLRFFEDHDELYWNVTGDEWPVPIESASAVVHLPPEVTGLRAVAFTGGYGSRERAARVEVGPSAVSVETVRRLNFREGLTVAVGWNTGLIRRPGPLAQAASFLGGNWMLGIPLLAFVVMFWLWYTHGRDPRLRPIAPQYEPPEKLTPAEVGTLVDNSPDMRDITATIVDLAVRGYLRIEEKEAPQLFGLWPRKEYVLHLRKEEAEWSALRPHESAIMDKLFRDGRRKSVKLSDLENEFYTALPGIRERIFERLIASGYYTRRPDRVKRFYLRMGGVIGILTLVAGSAGSAAWGQAPQGGFLAAVLTAIIVMGFGWFMPARTVRGARALEGVLGFEEFLSRVEADRFERVVKTPEMFERFLPYAMALGVETNWARAFESIYRQPPEWYQGTSFEGFSSRSFASDLRSMSGRAATVMASSPRGSGGSGFGGGGGGGGGGFSGGGFGGGGGGAF